METTISKNHDMNFVSLSLLSYGRTHKAIDGTLMTRMTFTLHISKDLIHETLPNCSYQSIQKIIYKGWELTIAAHGGLRSNNLHNFEDED